MRQCYRFSKMIKTCQVCIFHISEFTVMDNFIQYLCYFCDVLVELNHSVEVSSEYWSCQFCSEFICALVQGSRIFANN